jgi:hypothetical protein
MFSSSFLGCHLPPEVLPLVVRLQVRSPHSPDRRHLFIASFSFCARRSTLHSGGIVIRTNPQGSSQARGSSITGEEKLPVQFLPEAVLEVCVGFVPQITSPDAGDGLPTMKSVIRRDAVQALRPGDSACRLCPQVRRQGPQGRGCQPRSPWEEPRSTPNQRLEALSASSLASPSASGSPLQPASTRSCRC